MMEVEIRLFATLRQGRFHKRKLDLSEGTTVGEALKQLGIDTREVAILLVNGHHATEHDTLAPDGVMALFPPVAGG
jgi:molybdopterin converting factor small subunit